MADKEYKKFDSADKYRICGARLAKDAESRDGEHGKMVRLTFVSTSRKDAHTDMWVEANVSDFHAELASFLKKGDILHCIEGKPFLRMYGDDNEKFSFGIDRAEVTAPAALFAELKERGWVPGAKTTAAKKPGKPANKGKPAGKPVKPAAKKPTPVEIPDEDEEIEIEDDEDSE